MSDDEAFEAGIFGRESAMTVDLNWEGPVGFPQTFMPDEMAPETAEELLTLLDGCPVSPGLRNWIASVRGDVASCTAQEPLLP